MSSLPELNSAEQTLIEIIRQRKLSGLKIRFDKAGNISLIEATEVLQRVDASASLEHLMLKNGHQDISLSTHNGKLINCKVTTKHKL